MPPEQIQSLARVSGTAASGNVPGVEHLRGEASKLSKVCWVELVKVRQRKMFKNGKFGPLLDSQVPNHVDSTAASGAGQSNPTSTNMTGASGRAFAAVRRNGWDCMYLRAFEGRAAAQRSFRHRSGGHQAVSRIVGRGAGRSGDTPTRFNVQVAFASRWNATHPVSEVVSCRQNYFDVQTAFIDKGISLRHIREVFHNDAFVVTGFDASGNRGSSGNDDTQAAFDSSEAISLRCRVLAPRGNRRCVDEERVAWINVINSRTPALRLRHNEQCLRDVLSTMLSTLVHFLPVPVFDGRNFNLAGRRTLEEGDGQVHGNPSAVQEKRALMQCRSLAEAVALVCHHAGFQIFSTGGRSESVIAPSTASPALGTLPSALSAMQSRAAARTQSQTSPGRQPTQQLACFPEPTRSIPQQLTLLTTLTNRSSGDHSSAKSHDLLGAAVACFVADAIQDGILALGPILRLTEMEKAVMKHARASSCGAETPSQISVARPNSSRIGHRRRERSDGDVGRNPPTAPAESMRSQQTRHIWNEVLVTDWNSPSDMRQALQFLGASRNAVREATSPDAGGDPTLILTLLHSSVQSSEVRAFAVRCLRRCRLSSIQLRRMLLQLVQSLKGEARCFSALFDFLMEAAIRDPMEVGLALFWIVRTEVDTQVWLSVKWWVVDGLECMAGPFFFSFSFFAGLRHRPSPMNVWFGLLASGWFEWHWRSILAAFSRLFRRWAASCHV